MIILYIDCQEAHHLYQFAQTVDLSTFQDPGLDSSSHHQSGLGALNDSQDDSKSLCMDVLMDN